MTASIYGIGGLKTAFPDLAVSTYQRSVVWKGRQKASLIRSLLRDYPTGIIVLNSVPPPANVPPALAVAVPALGANHDIIDGQQRLTCIFEFLADPLRYVLEWQKKPVADAADREPFSIEHVRLRFDELTRALKPPRSNFVPVGTPKAQLTKRIREAAIIELQRHRAGLPFSNRSFELLIEAIENLVTEVGQKKVVVQELTNVGTVDAERMYFLINQSGTELKWWELLRVDHNFSGRAYAGSVPPHARHVPLVNAVAPRYRLGGQLRQVPAVPGSFWDALLTLGECIQYRLGVVDPRVAAHLLRDEERRLQVQGLGFRLVSAFLTHNVSRVAISDLFDSYSEEQVGRAVDTLIDTSEILFGGSPQRPPGFRLFQKYSQFRQDVIPAYPLLGLMVAAAKHVAINEQQGRGVTLTQNDTLNLRSLSEELFREALCTPKWAGSGDSKLRAWLDEHFEAPSGLGAQAQVPYPGRIRHAAPTYSAPEWTQYLNALASSGHPTADKNAAFLAFWTQYLYDGRLRGCLPAGLVEFDHIVPVQDAPGSMSTHPFNIAAVSERLNAQKKKRTYSSWAPTGADDSQYCLQALDSVSVNVNGIPSPALRYLPTANHPNLGQVIAQRKQIVEYALCNILPDWISNGD